MAKRQHYGIKFPSTATSFENTYVDLCQNPMDGIKSQLMHLIFTPVGQRLRKPTFGSKLIQFIFNPNDSQTWDDVVTEIRDMISKNIPNCSLKDISIYENEGGRGLMADIQYSVTANGTTIPDRIITNL
ncbi:MAG: GPW/gp25 family protein [Alphaproteobacteria bacterium]|nr:GPW/gp25 family protein [Alphaproteobacteria bacterium]